MHREKPRQLFLWYEELKEDQARAVRKIAGHLGVNLTPEQVDQVQIQINCLSLTVM